MVIRKLALFLLLVVLTGCAKRTPDSANPIQGKYLQNSGSDTMVNLALAWAEQYQSQNPEIRISVTGGGSGTGLSALINGTIDIANASRKIKLEETDQAKTNGFTPYETIVARDAIAVIVNPQNPIDHLTIQQLSAIYRGDITNWKEVGGEDRPIVRLSRETNSGTHTYFLETVIRLGNSKDKTIFSADTLLLPSSEGIIAEVRDNPNAIGYDGLGYVTSEVKVLAISPVKDSNAFILPSISSVEDKTYPISRDLYMYNKNEPVGLVKTYLEWVLSPAGQKIVSDLGFIPANNP